MRQKETNVNRRKINLSLPATHIHDILTAKCLLQRDNNFIHYQGFSPYSNFKFASSKIPIGEVANGISQNVGLGKFWQYLEISEAFLISLEVSFLHGLFLLFLKSQNFLPKSLGLGFLTRISASWRVLDFTIRHPL